MRSVRSTCARNRVALVALLLSSVSLQSCEYKAVLEPLQRYIVEPPQPVKTVNVNFCTDPAVAEKSAVKTLVILDHSGSNKLNYMMSPDGSGNPYVVNNQVTIASNLGTDPFGTLRYGTLTTPGSLLHFLNNLAPNDPADPLRYFSLVNFQSSAYYLPGLGAKFTADIPAFYQAVLTDARGGNAANPNGVPADTGSTSYLSALQAAYNMITADINAAKVCAAQPANAAPTLDCPHPGISRTSSYVIVMASDGAPIISTQGLSSSGSVTGNLVLTREPTNEILGLVQALVALTADKKYVSGVNLFTVHYVSPNNNVDNTARTLLAEMARVGQGLAYVSVSGSSIDFTRFQAPARLIKYLLSDLFVTNVSGAFGDDGLFASDRDSDGITDATEATLGLNPASADSNGNGVQDLVEYQIRGRGINIGTTCSGIQKNGSQYKASDPSGLNDCEKILLGDTGGINNPDSNSDGVPDWMAFKNSLPFQLNMAPAYLSTLSDGYTNYQKVKFSLPTQVPLTMIKGWKPSNYKLTQVSNTASQSCYKLAVKDLPFVGTTDKIRVEIVERSELLQDRFLYRSATKPFAASLNDLDFHDWNDAAEKAAGTWKVWP
jgi:hypothetical protein